MWLKGQKTYISEAQTGALVFRIKLRHPREKTDPEKFGNYVYNTVCGMRREEKMY